MTQILIFGGHGKIAQLVTRLFQAQGDQVTAVIRNPEQTGAVAALGATPLVADIEHLDTAAIAALISGHDAVVWSAGAGGGSPERTYAVDRDAAMRAMDAARLAGVARFVMVSYFGSSPEHGVAPENSFYAYAEAKAAADTHLRASELDWTVLGPGALTVEPASGLIDTAARASSSVSRGNVALAIRATLADPSTVRRTIRFNDGQTPVVEALSAAPRA